MSYRATALACVLLIPSLLTADVTLTYKVENKLSPSLPPAFAQTLGAAHILSAPSGRKVAVKGGKIFANTSVADMIADLPNDKLTLLNSANKNYVTIPVSQYAEQLAGSVPKLPAGMQTLLASIKLTVNSKLTGRTAEIQGIQAEEHEIVLSLGIPMGQGAGAPLSPVMKIVLQLWRAKPDEIAHNPALQEFVASGFLGLSGANPAESIQKMLSQFPSIADSVAAFSKEVIDTHSVTLRTHAEVSMPILAMLSRGGAASAAPAADPNAPIMEINEELASISTAPIPDSTFSVPDGYTAVPLVDFMSAMMPKPPAPKPAAAPTPAGK